jgi:hypothetical protein
MAGLAAGIALTAAGCDIGRTRPAHGEPTSLIIVAADSLWEGVRDSLQRALEPRVFTVRDEKTFEVTWISPGNPRWSDLSRFKQVLPIGLADDWWVAPALRDGPPDATPAIVERQNVWARGQLVTAIVVAPDDPVGGVEAVLPRLAALLDARFRDYARARMFFTRADTALRDELERTLGYGLVLPNVYRRTDLGTTQVFRNHADFGGVLMRSVAVAFREGVIEPTPDVALAWRDSLAAVAYDLEQAVQRDRLETREPVPGGLEVQGVWESRDVTWPAAGPFIVRVIPCPDNGRTYIVDAWLFAPGRAKYEYMIQLETILDSFHCGRAAAADPAA